MKVLALFSGMAVLTTAAVTQAQQPMVDCCRPTRVVYKPVVVTPAQHVVASPVTSDVPVRATYANPPVHTYQPAGVPPVTACCPTTAVPRYAYRPLMTIAPRPVEYYVGRGILGQPTVYVPKQPIRNFVRFLSP